MSQAQPAGETNDRTREAYELGWEASRRPDTAVDKMTAVNSLDAFRSGARYCNHLLPTLRQLAGYADPLGAGTYTDGTPTASRRLSELTTAFGNGWLDCAMGRPKYDALP